MPARLAVLLLAGLLLPGCFLFSSPRREYTQDDYFLVYRFLLPTELRAVWLRLETEEEKAEFAREHIYSPGCEVFRAYGATPGQVTAALDARPVRGMHKKLLLLAMRASPLRRWREGEEEVWLYRFHPQDFVGEVGGPTLEIRLVNDRVTQVVDETKGQYSEAVAGTPPRE